MDILQLKSAMILANLKKNRLIQLKYALSDINVLVHRSDPKLGQQAVTYNKKIKLFFFQSYIFKGLFI